MKPKDINKKEALNDIILLTYFVIHIRDKLCQRSQ